MADIADLLEHAGEVRPPALAELERVAVRRRRRAVTFAVTSVATGVVAVLLAVQVPWARDAAPAPVAPAPTRTTTTPPDPGRVTPPPADTTRGPFPTLTPEEVRNHPDAAAERNDIPVTAAPGVAARLWSVCLADCSRNTTYQDGEIQRALEVTRDGFRSGVLYPFVPPEPNVSHVIDDWFALDSIEEGSIVDSRGERRPLTRGSTVSVTDVAGPLVYSTSGVAYVDLETLELHVIEDDGRWWDWGGAADTWFWGSLTQTDESGEATQHGLSWRNADGSFGVRMLPVDFRTHGLQMLRSGTPGTMGAIDPSGPRRLLHVSTDFGATWDVRVMPESWGTGTFLPADWRSWVNVWPTWPTP